MKDISTFSDLYQLVNDLIHYILIDCGGKVWQKLHHDTLNYCGSIYRYANTCAIKCMNFQYKNGKISVNHLLDSVAEYWMDLKLEGKEFSRAMEDTWNSITWFWDDKKKEFGMESFVNDGMWIVSIRLRSLAFWIILLICTAWGPLLLSTVSLWLRQTMLERPLIEKAGSMSFRLLTNNDDDEVQSNGVVSNGTHEDERRRLHNEQIFKEEFDRILEQTIKDRKALGMKYNDGGKKMSHSTFGKILPPPLPHRIPTMKFEHKPLVEGLVGHSDNSKGIKNSFAILDECQELDSTVLSVDDLSSALPHNRFASKDYVVPSPADYSVFFAPIKDSPPPGIKEPYPSDTVPEKHATSGSVYDKKDVSQNENLVESYDSSFSDSSSWTLPDNASLRKHRIRLQDITEPRASLSLDTKTADEYRNVSRNEDVLEQYSQQIEEMLNENSIWDTPFRNLSEPEESPPNLDSLVIPEISPLDIPSPNAMESFPQGYDTSNESTIVEQNKNGESSDSSGVLLDSPFKHSEMRSDAKRSVLDNKYNTKLVVGPGGSVDKKETEQRIKNLVQRAGEPQLRSQTSPAATDSLQDFLLDIVHEQSLHGKAVLGSSDSTLEKDASTTNKTVSLNNKITLLGVITELPKSPNESAETVNDSEKMEGIRHRNSQETSVNEHLVNEGHDTEHKKEVIYGSQHGLTADLDSIPPPETDQGGSDGSVYGYEDESSSDFELPPNFIQEYHKEALHDFSQNLSHPTAPSSFSKSDESSTDSENSEGIISVLDDSSINQSTLLDRDEIRARTAKTSPSDRLDRNPHLLSSRPKHSIFSTPSIRKAPLPHLPAERMRTLQRDILHYEHARASSSSDVTLQNRIPGFIRARSTSPMRDLPSQPADGRNSYGVSSPSVMYRRMSQKNMPVPQLVEDGQARRPIFSLTNESSIKSGFEPSKIPRPLNRG